MKNSYFLMLALFTFAASINAQTIVSTKSSKKKVLLEEFGGIHCPLCPTFAHKIGDQLIKQNPNKIFLINFQTTGTAAPRGQNEPDFRTTYGDNVARLAGGASTPEGSINRRGFGTRRTAINGSQWANRINTIINEDAPINIGVKASLNTSTSKINITVETYVIDSTTSSGTGDFVLLNIVLTEDSIKDIQDNGSSYPKRSTSDGKYIHGHIFRTFLTSNISGDTIKIKNAGANYPFTKRRYNINLPTQIKNRKINPNHLEVTVFITKKNQQNILNVAHTKVIKNLSVNNTFFNNSLILYPNPAKEFLYFKLKDFKSSTSKLLNLTIRDIKGQIVATKQLSQKALNNHAENIKKLSSGIYFVEVSNGEKRITKKIIIE